MQPIATHGIEWSVGLRACVCVCYSRPCDLQKRITDRDADWDVDVGGLKESPFRWGQWGHPQV